jgi:hypothetical protein
MTGDKASDARVQGALDELEAAGRGLLRVEGDEAVIKQTLPRPVARLPRLPCRSLRHERPQHRPQPTPDIRPVAGRSARGNAVAAVRTGESVPIEGNETDRALRGLASAGGAPKDAARQGEELDTGLRPPRQSKRSERGEQDGQFYLRRLKIIS